MRFCGSCVFTKGSPSVHSPLSFSIASQKSLNLVRSLETASLDCYFVFTEMLSCNSNGKKACKNCGKQMTQINHTLQKKICGEPLMCFSS